MPRERLIRPKSLIRLVDGMSRGMFSSHPSAVEIRIVDRNKAYVLQLTAELWGSTCQRVTVVANRDSDG